MRIKSYTGKSVSEAMDKIRKDLGEEAIILATQNLPSGETQVTAAVEKSDPPAPTIPPKPTNGWAQNWDDDWKKPIPPSTPVKVKPRSPKPDFGGMEIVKGKKKTDALDIPVKPAPMASKSKKKTPEPPVNVTPEVHSLVRAMAYHGVPTLLAERICRSAIAAETDDIEMALAAALDQHFDFAPQFSRKNKPVMLIGPPGVGKTMTIAKMAATAILRGRVVHVITTDKSRAGAVEQLKSFTDILKLKLWVVDNAEELKNTLALPDLSDGAHVLIDTGGISCYDDEELSSLAELVISANAEAVVVLAAGTDSAEMSDTAIKFASIGAHKLIVTRLDTTRRYGGVLTAADNAGLKFSYASVSSSVAKGLHVINPVNLARLILRDPNDQEVSSEFDKAEK
ncbi:hypothetical protein GUA87_17080 [Sneathiella sp. P13V-1]|uniref:flagellar biosynthesis protein FlhF n=1 Tax=Sneathiella sp. P13V-1 TaxID=2697366 RepID=UPI00187BAB00|nr:hypothetical protein [Sneathiella sp. P13V-1]MBE7638573.1 hypothetical protein [Sneathiella sp. P13V-1]